MSSGHIIPTLAIPPVEYDQKYMALLIRNLNNYHRQQQNPNQGVFSGLRILNYPTASTGLPSGSIWVDTTAAYVLKVVP